MRSSQYKVQRSGKLIQRAKPTSNKKLNLLYELSNILLIFLYVFCALLASLFFSDAHYNTTALITLHQMTGCGYMIPISYLDDLF